MRALLAGLALIAAAAVHGSPLVGLPSPPIFTAAGYQLILDFEVGGGRSYYDATLSRPTWPGLSSGVTIGVGWDAGYNSTAALRSDWRKLPAPWIDRLSLTSSVTGKSAKTLIPPLRDILIEWKLAEGVFNEVTLARFTALSRRTFPGFDALHPNCQAALVSLVFNRGSSMAGPSRVEMRIIRDLVPKRDYAGMSAALRSMKRLWCREMSGLWRRRDAEAQLVESCH